MEKNRTDNRFKESGIALVTALVITVVVMLLIASLTYLFTKGFQTNILNRKFSSVYEAANGGVEYATGIINTYLDKQVFPGNFGQFTGNFSAVAGCTSLTDTVTLNVITADGVYKISSSIRCLGTKTIPGMGGALRFPPPPPIAGGGIGTGGGKYFNFYSIIADARETNNPENIGHTEAVYRAIQQ